MGLSIALEGTIGVGKTTLGTILQNAFSVPMLAELAAPETSVLLERYYADQPRWAFTMQAHFLIQRFEMMKRHDSAILDRSIFGDRVFGDMLHELGRMDDEEYATYAKLYDTLVGLVRPPDLLIFLDCTPETALERIRKRNRAAEGAITLDYLEHLGRDYARWFDRYEASPKLKIPYDNYPIFEDEHRDSLVARIRAMIDGTSGVGSEGRTEGRRADARVAGAVIRRATPDDLPAITRIYNEAIRTTTATFDTSEKTVDDRRIWLDAHDERHPVLVAVSAGEVVAWASLSRWSDRCAYDDTAEVSVYVDEAHRGAGIGRRLLEELVTAARKAGLHTLIARVVSGNEGSVRVHERAGFSRFGVMKEVGYKFGRRLDVHMMQMML